jgi:hypothetical protein
MEDLGHSPRLSYAAARMVGRLGVEDLADRADASLFEVRAEAIEEPRGVSLTSRVDAEPRVDEGTDEPRPDGPLVVRGVARAKVAVVPRAVARM